MGDLVPFCLADDTDEYEPDDGWSLVCQTHGLLAQGLTELAAVTCAAEHPCHITELDIVPDEDVDP
jgi:hypothetical protein